MSLVLASCISESHLCPVYRFTYSITKGNDDGFFHLDSASGSLSLARPLIAPPTSEFLLQIVAENAEHSCHRGRVHVRVAIRPNNIQFPALEEAAVPENAPVGSFVAQVQVPGFADQSLLYSIVAGNQGDVFSINASTGDITVAGELDFETDSEFALTVQAENATGGDTATGLQIVRVRDVNELPFFTTPCAVMGSCHFSLFENQPSGISLGSIEAGDPDLAGTSNGRLVYLLGTASVPFLVDMGGSLVTTMPLDREQEDNYMFELTVQDGGVVPLSMLTLVSVTVLDLNDSAPVFVQGPTRQPLREGAPRNTIVIQYVAIDNDLGSNADITYSLTAEEPVPFDLDPSSGILRVTAVLDREQRSEYMIMVTASNPGTNGFSATVSTTVVILDANDNPPVFTQPLYSVSVPENLPGGSSLVNVSASDRDSGSNGEVAYAILTGNFEGSLSIASDTGVISVAEGAVLDRETVPSLSLTVQARDFGQPERREATVSVLITLTDVNDNPPMFSAPFFMASVREDTRFPRDLLTVSASDRDQVGSQNSNITYTLTAGNEAQLFGINVLSGQIQLLGGVDFENQSRYELEVMASDNGEPQLSAVTMVIVMIEDVDESPPVVVGMATVNVSELVPVGSPLARLNATVLDPTTVSFAITAVTASGVSGASNGIFSINSTGYIILAQGLDFELTQSYTLQLLASDGVAMVTSTLTLNVVDENEFPPVFTGATSLPVDEELPAATPIATLMASDRDSGSNAEVTYSLLPDKPAADFFAVDSLTGVLSTVVVLDREALVERGLFLPPLSFEPVTVQARDGGIPSLSSQVELTIVLQDVNDNQPLFDRPSYRGEVSENLDVPAPVLQAVATDEDMASNAAIQYALVVVGDSSGSPPFMIDRATGLIETTQPLDREQQAEYSLVITATDGGSPALNQSVSALVHVLDVNDNAPQFTQPLFTLTLREDLIPGPLPFTLTAFDDDAGTNAQVTYDLMSSGVLPFSVNGSTGTLLLSARLDFETEERYAFTVRASDGDFPARTSTAQVSVTVTNVDETPPTFPNPCTVIVQEDVGVAYPVVQCLAVDFDDVIDGPGIIVAYDITAGNTAGAFEVSGDQPGTIVTATELDREVTDAYALTLRATDAAGQTATTVVQVTVGDVNDNSPMFVNISDTITMATEQIRVGVTRVTVLEALDADIAENGRFEFSILSSTREDLETELVVGVTDFGSPRRSSNATLHVMFETACLLQEYSVGGESGTISAQLLCSVSVAPAQLSITIGGNQRLNCPILRNIPATYEWIHNSSLITAPIALGATELAGDLLLFDVDFTDAGLYGCRASTEVGGLQSQSATVSIQGRSTSISRYETSMMFFLLSPSCSTSNDHSASAECCRDSWDSCYVHLHCHRHPFSILHLV